MDAYDPERRERLMAFVARLRTLCIRGGARPAIVLGLSAQKLLALWAEQEARGERERAELDRLMREPPGAMRPLEKNRSASVRRHMTLGEIEAA